MAFLEYDPFITKRADVVSDVSTSFHCLWLLSLSISVRGRRNFDATEKSEGNLIMSHFSFFFFFFFFFFALV